MKRAQITIFLLLALLMLVAFGFLFYMIGVETETKAEVNIEKITENLLRSTSIKYYIITCLDTASKDGLRLVGMQGGNIYDFQAAGTKYLVQPASNRYGFTTLPFRYNNVLYDVWYGIKAPKLQETDPYHLPVPWYPYNRSLVRAPEVLNVFGNTMPGALVTMSNLPFLCYKNSSNYFESKGFEWSCEYYNPEPTRTTQYYLERYIANKTRECVNLSIFAEKGYNVTEGEGINATVLFGEDNVFITLLYPITISIKGQQAFTKFLTYTSEQPVRLKKIYELAHHIIKEDVRNIFFDFSNETLKHYPDDCPGLNRTPEGIVRELQNTTCLYPGMNVTHYRNLCLVERLCTIKGNHSDVLVIQDRESLMSGKPYVFAFAIENRIPVLDYIDESVNSSFYYYTYLNNTYKLNLTRTYTNISSTPQNDNYNMVTQVGENILLFPLAIDPEEDVLTYNYSGWKTSITIQNMTGGDYHYYLRGIKINGTNVSGGPEVSLNFWQKSRAHKFGYEYRPPLRQNADYPSWGTVLQPKDVGYHWVRINVTDTAGLSDWQDIKIQVRCVDDNDNYPLNDCCDETAAADYHYKEEGVKCGTCKRCDSLGHCTFDSALSYEDCPACYNCTPTGCAVDNGDKSGKCAQKFAHSETRCCGGVCINAGSLPRPWDLPETDENGIPHFTRTEDCYGPGKCVGTKWRWLPLPQGTTCGSTGHCDSEGRCL